MTPEELAKFTEAAYDHGRAVATSVWSVRSTEKKRNSDRMAWARFIKAEAITVDLRRIANDHFWDGYDDAKNGMGLVS